jgi:dTDP-4-amino-4,6-dideoxygalactose transaminase
MELDIEEDCVPWFIDIYVNETKRKKLIIWLKNNGITVRAMYPTINSTQCYNTKPKWWQSLKKSDSLSKRGIWLPSSFNLLEDDVFKICDKIIEGVKLCGL